jgi:hypothetical protein
MNPIRILNNTYTSVASAWRGVSPDGLSLGTVRWRLRNGWDAHDAITFGVVPPAARRVHRAVRELRA